METQVCEEGTEAWMPVSSVLHALQGPTPVAMQKQRGPLAMTAQKHLAEIRGTSCYWGFRLLTNIVAGLAILFQTYALTAGVSETSSLAAKGSFGEGIMKARVLMVAIYLASIIGILTMRFLVLVLLDIADTLLFEHARKRNL